MNTVSDTGDLSGGSGACDTGATVVLPDTSVVAACSLRAAIQTANSNGNPSEQDRIEFDIPGAGLKTITQGTISYYITQPILIDGYTQSDASPNTTPWPQPMDAVLRVEIDANAVTDSFGSLAIGSNNITIKGLIVRNSNVSAVQGMGSSVDDITIQGNYFGTDDSGMLYDSVQAGIGLNAGFNRLTVGGPNPEDRNIIAAINRGLIGIGDNSIIQGNFFGVGADGVTAFQSGSAVSGAAETISITGANAMIGGASSELGNSIENNQSYPGLILAGTVNGKVLGNRIVGNNKGIAVLDNSSGLEIGDGTAAGRNIISGNDVLSDFATPAYGSGIEITNASGPIKIQGNYIGVAEDGASILPNGADGVSISDSTDVLIGGTQAGEANIIANNQQNGVTIVGNSANITTLSNAIYGNTQLGIDLLADPFGTYGVPTENDPLDPDTGPNDHLNYPTLLPPTTSGGNTNIGYRLDVPAGTYRIEFYSNTTADPSGHGEGESYIGSDTVVSNGAGVQLFNTAFAGTSFSNISATATRVDPDSSTGYGPTSEFSGPPQYESDIEVTKSIVDQNTLTTNGTIDYTVTFKNNGPDPIDLTQYTADAGNPLNTAIFNDIFPANLSLTSVTGDDIDCSEQNNASSFGSLFSSHTAFVVASCGYTGSNTSFASGQELSFTLHFTNNDSQQNVFSNYILSVPGRAGDDGYAEYQQAQGSGNDILNTLGTSINNLDVATTTKPNTDVGLTKSLNNPEDIAPGATLNYTVSFTNHGPDPLALAQYATPFATNPMIIDLVNPDLTPVSNGTPGPGFLPGSYYVNSGDPNLTCLWAGPATAQMLMTLSTNNDYGLLVCWYTGATRYLADDASVTASFSFTLDGTSNLDFANYVYTDPPSLSQDPDEATISSSLSGAPDQLEAAKNMNPQVNNFATSYPPTDIDLTASLVQPTTIQPGNTIYYDITLTNHGPAAYNTANYSSLSNSIIGGAFDTSLLSPIGPQNPGITCTGAGPGSIAYWGAAGSNHPNHEVFLCFNTGSGEVIAPGSSLTLRVGFTVLAAPTDQLSLYVINGTAPGDPDLPSFLNEFYTATSDVLDTITSDNFARVLYTVHTSGGGTGSTGTTNTNSNSLLSATGQNRLIVIAIAVMLVGCGGGVVVTLKKRTQKQM